MANLSQIIDDLKIERERIDNAIRALTSLDGMSPKVSARRTVSASVRRRIAAAQRARWAKVKGAPERYSAEAPHIRGWHSEDQSGR